MVGKCLELDFFADASMPLVEGIFKMTWRLGKDLILQLVVSWRRFLFFLHCFLKRDQESLKLFRILDKEPDVSREG